MAKLLGIKELCEFWQAIKVLLATKQNTLTAGSNITITGNTISASGEANVQSDWNEADTSSDAYIQNKPTIPPTMTILSYGHSTWADFLSAYNTNTIVYCRASSNSNPGTGSQNRLAFMAYLNNATNPTEVEFQYYRSVATHTATQQGDQVYVYKLNSNNTWSVTVREAYSRIVAGSGMSSSYASGILTLTATGGSIEPATATPAMDDIGDVGTSVKYAREDHVHPSDTSKADVSALDDYVEIAGDTMTGDLMIEKSDPRLYTKNPDIDMTEADNGVSATVYNGMRVYDANGKDIGCLYSSVRTSGLSRTGLWAYNYDTDGNLVGNNSMGVEVDKSGNLNYWVTNPVNFCSALGVGTYINISGGTSGNFSVPSGTTTNLVSMAIPSKGIWVVWGQIAYQSGGNSNYRCAYIGTSSTGNQLAAAQVPATTANTGVQVMAITQITNTTTTLYLNALHAAGQNLNCPKTSVRFRAVKIAPV